MNGGLKQDPQLLEVMMSLLGTGQDISLGLIGKKFLFFVVAIVVGWLAVPWLLKLFAPLRVTESVISVALIVCFALSYVADLMGVAAIIGAFATGIAVSRTPFLPTGIYSMLIHMRGEGFYG